MLASQGLFLNARIHPQSSEPYTCLHPRCLRCPPHLVTESFTSPLKCHFLWKPSPALQVKSEPTAIYFQSTPNFSSLPLWSCWHLLAWLLHVGVACSALSSVRAGQATRRSVWSLPRLPQCRVLSTPSRYVWRNEWTNASKTQALRKVEASVERCGCLLYSVERCDMHVSF